MNWGRHESTCYPIADAVTARLQTLQPSVYQPENESMRHAGYFEGKETHFKLTIASEAFARANAWYSVISWCMDSSMRYCLERWANSRVFNSSTYTQAEWQTVGQSRKSPIARDKTQGNKIKVTW